MADFSATGYTAQSDVQHLPPSVANYIETGKRPLSAMAPTILVQSDGEVNMVIGAAGGIRIPSAIAYVRKSALSF